MATTRTACLPRRSSSSLQALLALVAAVAVALALAGRAPAAGRSQDALSADAALGRVLDREGVARRRPVLAERWRPADERTRIEVGDWFETGARGANALRLGLGQGAELILGPGGLLEVTSAARVVLTRGELEVVLPEGRALEVGGPRSSTIEVRGRAVLRAAEGALRRLDDDPRWLSGYRGNASSEALGSLLANIDGRNVPLSMGYHQVSVDVRDQIARTVIEESFENHTPSVLEGVFYFPLPADASISGFGMWIGDELVQGEIVEKQRAREIYETILREKRDPGLLEWTGGSIFKARVYPIGAEKRIRIAYTQVLPKRGDTYAYHYALQSDLLRQFPLRRLRIQVDIHSSEPLAEVTSPSHDCRVQQSEHSARLEFEAEDFSPERDFELRVRSAAPAGRVTVAPHRRGDEGYFMLLLSAPEAEDLAERSDEPLELLLLADTSGSMWGPARDNQVAFVEALLGSLGPRDRFDLATVDVETRWAFDRPQASTPAAREAALGLLEARQPLGWTDLDRAFAQACERAGPRTQVIYVGDGAASAGDPDPAAFARRLARLYRGQGSFHAVVPGSSSEAVALDAMAALGGGSTRSIGGGTDPATTAFELLEELTTPAVKDLRLTFEGLEVAAVYPARLPNLSAGRQQIVLGRFDPRAGDLAGTVRVRGTLAGRPVEFSGEVALAAGEEGNSFVPRLWARRHLDQLLSQGSSKELRERVIALSEDFQVITPYTSFLVLESDEDRERFGVQQRLRMRDGEEFFAAGREAARHELTRQQMQKAKGWRLQMQARFRAGLADLERARTELLRAQGLLFDELNALGAMRSLGYVQAQTALRDGDFASTRAAGLREDFDLEEDKGDGLDDFAQGDDAGWDLPKEEAESSELAFAPPALRKLNASGPGSPGPGFGGAADEFFLGAGVHRQGRLDERLRGLYSAPGDTLSAGRAGRREVDRLDGLFPALPAAPGALSEPSWPAEVAAWLGAIDRRATIARAEGGFAIEVESSSQDLHGRSHGSTSRHLLSAREWVQELGGQLQWSSSGRRGVLTRGWRLGRTRESTAGDAAAWSEPLTFWFGYAGSSQVVFTPELEDLGDGRVRLVLTQANAPAYALVLVIERARGVLLESAWTQSGEARSRTLYSDFHQLAGAWWPGSARTLDAEGRELSSLRVRLEALAPAEFAGRRDAALAECEDAILLRDRTADLQGSKQAAREGAATLEQRWELLRHFAATQRWSEAAPHLAALEALAGDKPGLSVVQLGYLQLARQLERQKALLFSTASGLAARPHEAELAMAGALLGLASGLNQGSERLQLLSLLRPVYDRQADIPDAALVWDQQMAGALASLGRATQAFEQHERMAGLYPYQPGVQVEYARQLAQRGELDAALELLARVEAQNGPWQEHERTALRAGQLDLLWNGYRLPQLVATLEGWMRAEPAPIDSQTYNRYLSALVFLDREAEAWRQCAGWLELAGGETLDQDQRNRLQAAIWHGLGQGSGLYRYSGIEDEQAEALAATARVLASRDDRLDMAGWILQNHRFRQSDAAAALFDELMDEVEAGVEELPAARLSTAVGWLRSAAVAPAVGVAGEAAWQAILERVLERWRTATQTAERNSLDAILRAHGSRELLLRRHRHALAGAEAGQARVAAAFELVGALFEGAWSVAAETEVFELLDGLELEGDVQGEVATQNLERRILALYDLTGWLTRARAQAAVEALDDVNSMPRRILKSESTRLLDEARTAALARLAALETTQSPARLRDWVALDRIWLQVKTRTDLERARRDALALLAARLDDEASEADPRRKLRDHVLAARCVATLTWLLAHAPAELVAEHEAELVALLERGRQSQPELMDWRELLFVERVLLERTETLEHELEQWYGGGEDLAQVRWGTARAFLAAERGQLELAVRTLLEVEGLDEVDHDALRALGDWYTALDRPVDARQARIRSWEVLGEDALARRLQNEVQLYQRSGEEPPPELDPELPERLLALLRKAPEPARHIWLMQQLFRPTKDFALLECVPEGVLGHTTQGIYPYVHRLRDLFELIQEEATIDRLRVHLVELRAASQSDVDRRGLALLEFSMLRRAAAQAHGTQRHAEGARAALLACDRGQWAEGEPGLMAEFLAAQGALQPAALAEVQLRLLRDLRTAATDPEERYAVAKALATTLWAYSRQAPSATFGRQAEAIGVLTGALESLREASGGRLPIQANEGLTTLSAWLAASGQWMTAETLWNGELSAGHPHSQDLWLTVQLHGLYRDALLAEAELSLGKGRALYLAVVQSFSRALAVPTDENHATQLVTTLCDLWTRGFAKRATGAPVAELADFAFGELPGVLALYQYRNGQSMVSSVARCLEKVNGPLAALEFLTVRAETEPRWLRLANQDFWSQQSSHYGDLRRRVRSGGDALDRRVLAIVLRALREDLTSRQARNRSMYQAHNSDFWSEKRADFLREALQVLSERRDSGRSVAYICQYLFFGLDAFDQAITGMQDAHRRQLLDIEGRRSLCDMLQRRERWRESVTPLIELVGDQPAAWDNRTMLMLAYFHLGESRNLLRTLDAAEAWFRENERWTEDPIAALAGACLATELHERSIALFDEAIALHVKTAPRRGVGDGVLSSYYRDKAGALSGLGRTDEAVDAAAGAIVSWGADIGSRSWDLQRLREILAVAEDLDEYIVRLDAEAARSGLENPIVRKALGQVLSDKHRFGAAVVQLRLALDAQPNDAETHDALVLAYDQARQPAQAAQAVLARARLAAHDVRLWSDLGDRLLRSKQAEAAERAFTSLAEMLPNESEGYARLAQVRQGQQRWSEAADAWRQVARVRSQEPTGYLNLARCLIESESLTEAAEVLETLAVTSWPERFRDVERETEMLRARLRRSR